MHVALSLPLLALQSCGGREPPAPPPAPAVQPSRAQSTASPPTATCLCAQEPAARSPFHAVHGKCGAQHQWQPGAACGAVADFGRPAAGCLCQHPSAMCSPCCHRSLFCSSVFTTMGARCTPRPPTELPASLFNSCAVLHHHRAHALAGRQAHSVWARGQGHGRCSGHREGGAFWHLKRFNW